MTKLKLVFNLTILSSLMLINSCTIPLEFALKKDIRFSKETVSIMREKILEKLSSISFDNPGSTIPAEECSKAYQAWLKEAFAWGYLPKKVITPEDYGKFSNHPLISQCKEINFGKEYQQTAEIVARDMNVEVFLFSMEDLREKLRDQRCAQDFIDPKKGKLKLTSITLQVNNGLTVRAPRYNVYSSTKVVTAEIVNTISEKSLVQDGTLLLLAQASQVPAKFIGNFPVEPISDAVQYREAITPLLSVRGSFVAYPDLDGFQPETIKLGGQDHYIVPDGDFFAKIIISLAFIGTLSDVSCAYNEFIRLIEEAEAEAKSMDDA